MLCNCSWENMSEEVKQALLSSSFLTRVVSSIHFEHIFFNICNIPFIRRETREEFLPILQTWLKSVGKEFLHLWMRCIIFISCDSQHWIQVWERWKWQRLRISGKKMAVIWRWRKHLRESEICLQITSKELRCLENMWVAERVNDFQVRRHLRGRWSLLFSSPVKRASSQSTSPSLWRVFIHSRVKRLINLDEVLSSLWYQNEFPVGFSFRLHYFDLVSSWLKHWTFIHLNVTLVSWNHLFLSSLSFPSSLIQLLELHENRITSISRATFYGMSASDTIDNLNLASNAISDIPSNCFHDLNVLSALSLEGNSLKDLHPHAFQGVEGKSSFSWSLNSLIPIIPLLFIFMFSGIPKAVQK
jgi:hypothetical protein